MNRILLTLCVLLFAAISGPSLRAEIVSAKTAKVAIANSDVADAIQGRLVDQGMSAAAATDLIHQMSADEITYFGKEAERNQAGGDLGSALIFVLVVAALVVLIVYLVERT